MSNIDSLRGAALEQLFELGDLLAACMDRELADDLTPARAYLLWCLHEHGPLTQREISQELGCSPRNVTGLVDGLEATGLASRGRHPSDGRATLVALTEAGAARAGTWRADYDALADELFGVLDESDISLLSNILDKLLSLLRDTPG